jgi:pectate lyase
VTRGGEDGVVYRVKSLAGSGPGTLREAIRSHDGTPRKVVFDVGGTITISESLVVRAPNLTIDGSTAPEPGITVQQAVFTAGFIVAGTHDVVLRHIRVRGLYVDGGETGGQKATLIIDGDRRPDRIARRVVFDHVTVAQSGDSAPDIWGDVEDVTVQWCLFYDSKHPTTVSGPRARHRISMHHNVYARNAERNPQVRGRMDTLDYVNNVVYGWAAFPSLGNGYGMRIRNTPRGSVNANIVNNAFVPRAGYKSWALVYGERPGPEASEGSVPATQVPGSLVTSSRMGRLWVAGNLLPRENRDHYSTVSEPLEIPTTARVTTWPATELRQRMLPFVGVRFRTAEEQALIDEVAAAIPIR